MISKEAQPSVPEPTKKTNPPLPTTIFPSAFALPDILFQIHRRPLPSSPKK